MPVIIRHASRLIISRSHAENAVDLLDNLYTVHSGSSWLDVSEPSTAEQEALRKYQVAAHIALHEAKRDFARIEADYEEQQIRYLKYYGREPTDEELLEVHLSRDKDEMEATLGMSIWTRRMLGMILTRISL